MLYFTNKYLDYTKLCHFMMCIHILVEKKSINNIVICQVMKHHGSEGKAIPVQLWRGPYSFWRLGLPHFTKVVRLPALSTGRLYPTGNTRRTHFS
jgi:hypothetical protein